MCILHRFYTFPQATDMQTMPENRINLLIIIIIIREISALGRFCHNRPHVCPPVDMSGDKPMIHRGNAFLHHHHFFKFLILIDRCYPFRPMLDLGKHDA